MSAIKLIKAKTCYGCRANETDASSPYRIRYYCVLGYETDDETPLESCPKPKTVKYLVELLTKKQ